MSNISILIPDSQDHKSLVLQVIHCLSLQKGIKIYIMSSDKQNYLKYSRHVKHFVHHPETGDSDWVNNIDKEVLKYNIDVILPVFEIGIKRLIENKMYLEAKEKLCILPNFTNFNTAINKGMLYEHLNHNRFPCPKSVVVKGNEIPNLNTLKFPVIAKPVEGFGGGKEVVVLKNNDDVLKYSKSSGFECNTIYQNFIKGYDLCCNVLCDKGIVTAYSIQKASVSEKGDVTPQKGFRFIEEPEVLEITKKVMKSIDWSGVANVDFRYDEEEKIFKIIEINTRYWINVDASAVANLNFPYLHCLSTLDISYEIYRANNISYVNLKGLVKEVVKKPSKVFKIGFLKNNTPLWLALKDPFPMAYRFIWRTKNVIVSKITKA